MHTFEVVRTELLKLNGPADSPNFSAWIFVYVSAIMTILRFYAEADSESGDSESDEPKARYRNRYQQITQDDEKKGRKRSARERNRAERERLARKEAERLLQQKSAELFDALQRTRDSERQLQLALWASGEGIWSWEARSDLVRIDHFQIAGDAVTVVPNTTAVMRRLVHHDDLPKYMIAWHIAEPITEQAEKTLRWRQIAPCPSQA